MDIMGSIRIKFLALVNLLLNPRICFMGLPHLGKMGTLILAVTMFGLPASLRW
jgi:hypothetical protein